MRVEAEERSWAPTVYTSPDSSSLTLMLEEPETCNAIYYARSPLLSKGNLKGLHKE